ncbi:MAG: rhamnogalacturonan acetylesterase [Spirochaetaceae bacterium]|nr:rhamnogalacturonan acetylesterase [Spirochaetaceae bacterium]
MKRKCFSSILALISMLCFFGCSSTPIQETDSKLSDSSKDATPTIFLAGDSTVKTHADAQYIAGWGQYFGNFFDSTIKVVNCAQGGRSTRSFINEGRLFNIDNPSYTYKFSENAGRSIEDDIKAGDFLFIQFGHNDDDTKSGNTMYNRMVPLGTPDANGIYPVIPGEKVPTTHLPEKFKKDFASSVAAAETEIAKYGSEYYSYDCGGTYKWFLKQYIDFSRSKGATPVLVTPVARVSFNSDGTLRSGPGLHGENFAYVEAVRQLAKEENCLLIDLFDCTKSMIETATKAYANYLMAIVPNDLNGQWPSGYDNTYGNTAEGFEKVEATHYNKYGAYLTAAMAIEKIMGDNSVCENGECFNFTNHILKVPTVKVAPSTLISKSFVKKINGLVKTLDIVNTDVVYANPDDVVKLIKGIVAKGEVTAENYLEIQGLCEEARGAYLKVNVDDKPQVTNFAKLEEYEEAVKAMIDSLRPKASKTVILNTEGFSVETITSEKDFGKFKIVGASGKAVDVKSKSSSFDYNGVNYSVTTGISLGGSASFGTSRYVVFDTEGPCRVTVVAQSSGEDERELRLVSSADTKTTVATFAASTKASPAAVNSADIANAGTYYIGSANKGIWICAIIIEYF